MKKHIIYSLMALLALASCSSELDNCVDEGKMGQEIVFYASLESPAMSRASGLAHDQQIQATDTYGMFVANTTSSETLWNGVKMNPVSDSGDGNSVQLLPEDSENKLYAPLTSAEYIFIAISPYIQQFLNTDFLTAEKDGGCPFWHVESNQHNFADYCASDLCIGSLSKTMGFDNSGNTTNVIVPMNHMLSKILIKIDGSDSYLEAKEDISSVQINKIEILNVAKWYKLQHSGGKWSDIIIGSYVLPPNSMGLGEVGDIIVSQYYKDNNATDGVACIIPPQTVSSENAFIRITSSTGVSWIYKLPEDYTFEGNKAYEFDLALNRPKVGETTGTIQDVKVKVVDWTKVSDTFNILLNH